MNIKDYLQVERISQKDIATCIGVAPSYFCQMLSGHRPWKPLHCAAIERITNGKVTRQDLRPNDYWLIWPDLKSPKAKKEAV